MNWLDQLAPWAVQLGTNSLKAVPLILLLVAFQKRAGRWISPHGIKLLWFLALIRLFMPEIAATPASIYNLLQRPHPLATAPPAVPDYTAESKPGVFGPEYSFTPHAPPVPAPPQPTAPIPNRENAAPTLSPLWSRAEIATAVWLAGVVVMMALLSGQSWRFHRRFAGLPVCTDPVLLALLDDCKKRAGIKKPVALIVSDAVAVPALYRFFRPRILLPAALTRSLPPAQLRCIFQHELAHVSSGDIAINWLVAFTVAVHWFNPFVWLMARSIAQAREMACDRVVLERLSDPQIYGETIVRVAEGLSRPHFVAGVAAIAESRNALKERIRMLTQKQSRHAWLAASVTALVLGILFLSSAVQAAMPKTVKVPGLPGASISLADALGRADIMVVGQVVSVKYEGTDAMTDRYWVKINVTLDVIPKFLGTTMPGPLPPIEGEVRVTNPASLGNVISGSDVIPVVQEKIPEDGPKYFFFISTDNKAKSNLIFKMLPGGMVMPSAVLEFPESRDTLESLLLDHPNIVVGRFVNMRPRFVTSSISGTKIDWRREEKAVIDVKKRCEGKWPSA